MGLTSYDQIGHDGHGVALRLGVGIPGLALETSNSSQKTHGLLSHLNYLSMGAFFKFRGTFTGDIMSSVALLFKYVV